MTKERGDPLATSTRLNGCLTLGGVGEIRGCGRPPSEKGGSSGEDTTLKQVDNYLDFE